MALLSVLIYSARNPLLIGAHHPQPALAPLPFCCTHSSSSWQQPRTTHEFSKYYYHWKAVLC